MKFETSEYELLEINYELFYDFGNIGNPRIIADGSYINEPKDIAPVFEYDENGIPKGKSIEEIRMRQKILKDFLSEWVLSNPEKKRYNKYLKDDIHLKRFHLRKYMNIRPKVICPHVP